MSLPGTGRGTASRRLGVVGTLATLRACHKSPPSAACGVCHLPVSGRT